MKFLPVAHRRWGLVTNVVLGCILWMGTGCGPKSPEGGPTSGTGSGRPAEGVAEGGKVGGGDGEKVVITSEVGEGGKENSVLTPQVNDGAGAGAGEEVVSMGAESGSGSAKWYLDTDYGIKMKWPAKSWVRGGPGAMGIPGELCHVWSDPQHPNHCLFVFVRGERQAQSNTRMNAKALGEKLERIYSNTVDAKVLENAVVEVNGMQAASFQFSAKGNGYLVDGLGDVDTTQHWLAIPRENELVVLVLTTPSEEFGGKVEFFQALWQGLEITASRPATTPGIPQFYQDEDYGIRVSYPRSGWVRGGYQLGGFYVPGEMCRVWSRTEKESSLMALFVRRTENSLGAAEVLSITKQELSSTPGVTVVEEEVRDLNGMQAFWLVVRGDGNGYGFSVRGEVATTQQWVGVPRKSDVVYFLASAPSIDFPGLRNDFTTLVTNSRIEGEQVLIPGAQ